MKTVVNIPLKANTRVKVEEGQKIEKGETIASNFDDEKIIEINLSEILKIKGRDIFKFLKKKPTESIARNEILAQRKSFVSTLLVRSPIGGVISHIDLTRGTVHIKPEMPSSTQKITSPVAGVIRTIARDQIAIEIKGTKISGIGGRGAEISGELLNVAKMHSSIFELGIEVEDKIVLINQVTADVMAKLDTLGSRGIITEKVQKYGEFPYILVNNHIFKDLEAYNGQNVWMRPGAAEVIIIED